jgi:hypothetical protein
MVALYGLDQGEDRRCGDRFAGRREVGHDRILRKAPTVGGRDAGSALVLTGMRAKRDLMVNAEEPGLISRHQLATLVADLGGNHIAATS